MAMQFVVLASGSAGNCSFLRTENFGLLIDSGLGPRQLETRLASAGLGWSDIQAVLLTHTHTDHWNERTLTRLAELQIPFHCHPQHQRNLQAISSAFGGLAKCGLVRNYAAGVAWELAPGLKCLPIPLQHDSVMTCGFRFEGPTDIFGRPTTLAYAADLGCWDAALVKLLADAEVLALEFNHDVALQRGSGRSRQTIARNLGNKGHLSNEQAAALVGAVLSHSQTDSLQHIVQLHLSRECNEPDLAVRALHGVLASTGFRLQVHTAAQDQAGPCLTFGEAREQRRRGGNRRAIKSTPEAQFVQAYLPGWEE